MEAWENAQSSGHEALILDAQHLSEPGMMGTPVASVLLGRDRMIWGLAVQPG